ncbi:cell division protein FtsQ/DivIB [Terricaulis sp.]|uniref:cell division protein FtsQ/DivIB n=1 Tax=Terricaulis sp. TaxID=2768686 RepID=UPI0037841BD5
MAAVRARRGGGRMPPEPPPRKRRRAAPPPPTNIPRLAAIKLNGGLRAEDAQVSGKSLLLALTGVIFFTGAAIAGATWLGSSLFDAGEAFSRAADGVAADTGFAVNDIRIEGVVGARAAEVRAVIVPEGRQSLLSLEPAEVQARIEGLGWVQSARVRRLWPSTLDIRVARREAYARWQEDGQVSVIDLNGERLLTERAADHGELPLVVGRGAGPEAQPLLAALEELPQVRERLNALVRVGDRRWNVELKSGATVALPEEGAAIALARLEGLQTAHMLLDRPVDAIDMRAPGRVAVRIHPELAGSPLLLAGGA